MAWAPALMLKLIALFCASLPPTLAVLFFPHPKLEIHVRQLKGRHGFALKCLFNVKNLSRMQDWDGSGARVLFQCFQTSYNDDTQSTNNHNCSTRSQHALKYLKEINKGRKNEPLLAWQTGNTENLLRHESHTVNLFSLTIKCHSLAL